MLCGHTADRQTDRAAAAAAVDLMELWWWRQLGQLETPPDRSRLLTCCQRPLAGQWRQQQQQLFRGRFSLSLLSASSSGNWRNWSTIIITIMVTIWRLSQTIGGADSAAAPAVRLHRQARLLRPPLLLLLNTFWASCQRVYVTRDQHEAAGNHRRRSLPAPLPPNRFGGNVFVAEVGLVRAGAN